MISNFINKNDSDFDVILHQMIKVGGDRINNTSSSLFFLLSLTTGLPLGSFLKLKWNDLLTMGSDNELIVKGELWLRQYANPIHPVVGSLIYRYYTKLGFPSLDQLISDSLFKHDINRLDRIVIRELNPFCNTNHIKNYDNEEIKLIPLILFGRKFFKVHGYTNIVSKKLKLHYKIKTTKELFDFLGYNSKEDIQFKLSDVNLAPKIIIVNLDDKNFNTGYEFQKFGVFEKFLLNSKSHNESYATKSIKILLLLSLYNGIRPSALLRLNWDDVITIKQPKNRREIHQSIHFENRTLNIPIAVANLLESFVLRNYNYVPVEDRIDDFDFEIKGKILNKVIADPSIPIFRMNNGNRMIQPNLLREIKNALIQLSFPHVDKFTTKSTVIMYARRILEIKGDHPQTLSKLTKQFNFINKNEMLKYFKIDISIAEEKKGFEMKSMLNIFSEIFYDL